jgi:hypothetical protein
LPLVAGLARVTSLVVGAPALEGASRFAADPLVGALHIIGSAAFFTAGALQFLPSSRRSAWHRRAGQVLAGCAVTAALTGVWMVWRWAPKPWDSPALNAVRLVVAVAIIGAVITSLLAARRRDFVAHGAWMTRAWALAAGAGTQVLTLSVFAALGSAQSHAAYAGCMSAGWLINALAAELVLSRARVPALVEVRS